MLCMVMVHRCVSVLCCHGSLPAPSHSWTGGLRGRGCRAHSPADHGLTSPPAYIGAASAGPEESRLAFGQRNSKPAAQ